MACSLSTEELRRLTREFTELHEGLPPDQITCTQYQGPALPVRIAGRVVQIDYDKLVPYGKQWYYHPISARAQPTFGFDSRGTPVVYAGKVHVTTHGIEDFSTPNQSRERVPAQPRSLVVFGRLRQILYKPTSGSRTETWKPSRFFALAHDEHGTLHLFPEGKTTMARRRHYRRHARRNPASSALTTIGQVAAAGLGGALVAGVAVKVLQPKFAGYKLAAAEVGTGLVLAAAAAAMRAKPVIVAGLGIAPVAIGGLTAYQTYDQQKALPSSAASTNAATNHAPAMGALMPGGLPRGYYAVPRQSCAVR